MSDPRANPAEAWPVEIRIAPDRRSMEIDFDDGTRALLRAELLRVESPSAEVQGHSPRQKKTVPGKANVAIRDVEPVGRYAIRIIFDDGHDTGLYSWRYLHELAGRMDEAWSDYLRRLAEQGLSRDG